MKGKMCKPVKITKKTSIRQIKLGTAVVLTLIQPNKRLMDESMIQFLFYSVCKQ